MWLGQAKDQEVLLQEGQPGPHTGEGLDLSCRGGGRQHSWVCAEEDEPAVENLGDV